MADRRGDHAAEGLCARRSDTPLQAVETLSQMRALLRGQGPDLRAANLPVKARRQILRTALPGRPDQPGVPTVDRESPGYAMCLPYVRGSDRRGNFPGVLLLERTASQQSRGGSREQAREGRQLCFANQVTLPLSQ